MARPGPKLSSHTFHAAMCAEGRVQKASYLGGRGLLGAGASPKNSVAARPEFAVLGRIMTVGGGGQAGGYGGRRATSVGANFLRARRLATGSQFYTVHKGRSVDGAAALTDSSGVCGWQNYHSSWCTRLFAGRPGRLCLLCHWLGECMEG